MTLTRRRIAAATIAIAAAIGLTACDGDPGDPSTDDPTTQEETTSDEPTSDEPTSDEPTTDDPTTEPATDVAEPDVPPEMLVDDPTGAAAATWYFLELYDYMRLTGDTAAFTRMFSDDCGWCDRIASQVAEVYAAGGHVLGADLTFDISTATVELPVEQRPYYFVEISEAVDQQFQVVQSDGTVTEQPEQALAPLHVGVAFDGDRFVVVGVDFETA